MNLNLFKRQNPIKEIDRKGKHGLLKKRINQVNNQCEPESV